MSHTNREKNIIFHHLENIYRYGFGFLSPIVWAAENGYAEVIKVLTPIFIKDYLNEDWNPYEDNLIYRAAEKGHTDVIKELLPSFANNQMLQINWEGLQYMWQENMVTQKSSNSWLHWLIILMLLIEMGGLQCMRQQLMATKDSLKY